MAQQKVSKWDLEQWQAVVDELKDEDWLPEAKTRANVIGTFAGMSLGMMVGAIGAMAILRLQNRKQQLVQAKRDEEQRSSLDLVNKNMAKPTTKKAVQKAYDAEIAKAQENWEQKAKAAQKAGKQPPERILPGAELSDRLWSDSDKLLADVQTSMFDTMTRSHTVSDLSKLVDAHRKASSREPATIGDKAQANNYVTERLLRTELARMTDSVNTASYISNGIGWVNIVTEPGVCSLCAPLASGGPYKIDSAPLLPDDTHPNCRCVKVPAMGPADSPDLTDDTIKASGAVTGRYNDTNDPHLDKRDEIATTMYDEFKKARRSNLVSKISLNTSVDTETVASALTHVFDSKYSLYSPTAYISGGPSHVIKHFDPDYDMALSIQRLRIGKAISPDIIMLKHEALEAKLMDEKGMKYDDAHAEANKSFNYVAALIKWKEAHHEQ